MATTTQSLHTAIPVSGFESSATKAKPTNRKVMKVGAKTVHLGLKATDTMGNEFDVPDYTIKDILSAIPKKCFIRKWYKGMFYIGRDILSAVVLGYLAITLIPKIPNQFLRGCLWVANAFLMSIPYTGLWVMAHECGHQAFSPYGWLNDTVGWILHSYLLVPYFSWKYSHGKHHKATGHIRRDMVFVPSTKEEFLKKRNAVHFSDIAVDTPIYTLYTILVQQFGGWW